MKKSLLLVLFSVVIASGCVNQNESLSFNPDQSQQLNGMEVSYSDSVPESYVDNFTSAFNASDDIDRVAFGNTGDGYSVKIYTKRSSADNINNLDTQETVNKISNDMFDGAEVTLYIATMQGEVAQKATSE